MNPLDDPYKTMWLGFGLAVLLAIAVAVTAGSSETDWTGLVLRWAHFLAGITWIGLLYFFNLINAGFLKSLDGPQKNVVIPRLMPPALAWFRHGATVTVLAGILLYGYLYGAKGGAKAISVGIGGLLGVIMFLNVWLIIWPNQRKVIEAVSKTAKDGTPAPPEMAGWGRKALLASRVNFMLSIPMLLFMGSDHFIK
jgi:uncharacterized membrane protein